MRLFGPIAPIAESLLHGASAAAVQRCMCGANATAQILYFDETGRYSTAIAPPFPTPFLARYQMSVTFPTPAPNNPGGTYADLKVIWPAAVDPSTTRPSGSVEMFTALDRH